MGLKDFFRNPEAPEEPGFHDYTPFEYSLFWVLHLLIIFCTIYLVGGDLQGCIQVFFQLVNPLNWR